MRYYPALIAVVLAGCTIQPRAQNPFPGVFRVAVIPFNDKSNGGAGLNTDRITAAFASELQRIPTVEVVPLQEVKEVLGPVRIDTNQPQLALAVARAVHAQAVVVGDVVEYDPYYPPRLGLHCELYAMVTGQPEAVVLEPPQPPPPPRSKKHHGLKAPRHEQPPADPSDPMRCPPLDALRSAVSKHKKHAKKTEAPSTDPEPCWIASATPTDPCPKPQRPKRLLDTIRDKLKGDDVSSQPKDSAMAHRGQPAHSPPVDALRVLLGKAQVVQPGEEVGPDPAAGHSLGTEEPAQPNDGSQGPLVVPPGTGPDAAAASERRPGYVRHDPQLVQTHFEGLTAPDDPRVKWDGGPAVVHPAVEKTVGRHWLWDSPKAWVDRREELQTQATAEDYHEGRVPDHQISLIAPVHPMPVVEPWVVRHSRIFDGSNRGLVRRVKDYVHMHTDLRGGDEFGYLERVQDFERFCCYRMIYEMLEAAGGDWTPLRGIELPQPWEPWPWR